MWEDYDWRDEPPDTRRTMTAFSSTWKIPTGRICISFESPSPAGCHSREGISKA